MTRERLRALFVGVLRSRDWSQLITEETEADGVVDLSDELKLASAIIRDLESGKENMNIEWRVRRNTLAHVRLINDRHTLHAMQHPIHLHGQRFLVLAQNEVPTTNLVWKDTALVPAGGTLDLLVDFSNPGDWMIHCHIAEHLEAGMHAMVRVE